MSAHIGCRHHAEMWCKGCHRRAVARAERERDEARAELERLRAYVTEWCAATREEFGGDG